MDINQLSDYELYQLKSIDPTLSSDWYELIKTILPKLNQESQYSVYINILKPRGIYIGADNKLLYRRPETLASVMPNINTNNKQLKSISASMLSLINTNIERYDAFILADKIEALLGYIDNLDVQDSLIDQKNRQSIKTAFLYDLAIWIDDIQLEIDSGLREMNSDIVKSYFKEVFIKQQIQGRDFRSWDSSDLSFQELTHLPIFIKKQGLDRKIYIVEGQKYWFLIGIADQPQKNPYSFRRFLHEDNSDNHNSKYIYLTHVTLDKARIDNKQYMADAAYCMTRLYTLDRGVSETILKFVNQIQQLHKKYLKPILKESLRQDGSQPEIVIKNHLIKYEKQLSILILQKLPAIIKITQNDINDQNYLFYNLDQLIKQMSDNIQDFRLQPLVMYSASGEVMAVKLISLRRILIKSRHILCSSEDEESMDSIRMETAFLSIKEKLEEIESSLEEIVEVKEEIKNHALIEESGSFWQKLKSGKKPDYTLEELVDIKASLQETFFMYVVRLAKTEHFSMVYPEFECNEVVNENYRHYAIADGVSGVSRLPRVLRLNEDRKKFSIESIKEAINQDIFNSNQQWEPSA